MKTAPYSTYDTNAPYRLTTSRLPATSVFFPLCFPEAQHFADHFICKTKENCRPLSTSLQIKLFFRPSHHERGKFLRGAADSYTAPTRSFRHTGQLVRATRSLIPRRLSNTPPVLVLDLQNNRIQNGRAPPLLPKGWRDILSPAAPHISF